MMKALSVIELAEVYGMNRQSIYKRINKGDLSKNSDGKIDFSEAIRVFGEPSSKSKNVTTLQSTTVQKQTEVDILKQQVDILKKQLELAQEREIFQREQLKTKDNQIEVIQRLLESPKTNMTTFNNQKLSHDQDIATNPQSETNTNYDELTNQLETQTKNISVARQAKKEFQKRGLFGRLTKAFFDD